LSLYQQAVMRAALARKKRQVLKEIGHKGIVLGGSEADGLGDGGNLPVCRMRCGFGFLHLFQRSRLESEKDFFLVLGTPLCIASMGAVCSLCSHKIASLLSLILLFFHISSHRALLISRLASVRA